MQTLLTLAIGALFGAACSYYAKQRGRDGIGWFFIGLFFGLLGLILLFILPSKKAREPKEKWEPAPTIEILSPQKNNPTNRPTLFWYYLDSANKQFGPMSYEALQSAVAEKKVTHDTYVWNEEMDNWKLFGEIPKNEETPS